MTQTDYKIQTMLMRGFNMHFPNLNIVAEETTQFQGAINFDYKSLIDDILPSESNIKEDIDLKQACLWIDPIDCTLGFVSGNYEDVTVLIGLSYNHKPLVGIIGTPYQLVQG